jgi:hypothetical protein
LGENWGSCRARGCLLKDAFMSGSGRFGVVRQEKKGQRQ